MALRGLVDRLFGAPKAPPPRLVELAERVTDLELAVETLNARLADALQGINARITNAMRKPAGNGAQSLEDAPGSTNEPSPHVGYGHGQLHQPRVRRNY